MDNEMSEHISTTDTTYDDVYNELLEVVNEFGNSPLGETMGSSSLNAESDNSQSEQSGPTGNAACEQSPVMQPGPSSIAEHEAIGYLHNISPIKKGKYFEFQLQEKTKTVRGVCFSPPKRKRFTELGEKDTPVKIKKYRVDSTSNSEDLLMGNDVMIQEYIDVDFQKQELPSTMNVSNLKSVYRGQIVTVTAKVAHVYPPKRVGLKKLLMQNVVIVDPSGKIPLTLWENYVHQVKAGNTYTFSNIRVRKDKFTSETVVTTVESDTKIDPAPPFQEALPIVVLDSETVNVEIIGIDKIQSYLACSKCSKKVEHDNDGRFIECSSCHIKQKKTALTKHWFAHVLVKSKSSIETKKFSVTFFENSMKQIAETNSKIVDEFTKELIEDILFDTSIISITYNKHSHIVENIISAESILQ